MKALQILIVLAVGYLLGSVLPALIIGKMLNGVDIRKYGSGNPGTTNVLRTMGIGPAILVFAIDVLKGVVATLFAKIFMPDDVVLGVTLAGFAVICGHNWPLYFGFRGGKAVATSIGVALVATPVITLVVIPLALIVLVLTRYMSLTSIVGSILYFFAILIFAREYWFLALVIMIVIIIRHRENIKRLLNGTERKVGERVKLR
ncbi:glycerol-3-phosphate 1-O-acyltransferase PlsY [Caldicellulosiruptor naganoensis]|uniref:Glycerol-3-phosphate acyltransferase n=1 Tax=Caldicellulosiruptor naganoensis TaxID=29324 RepID=A0ABY7BE87_9FIRM|nr:glycerol-3-phosphate 1-O-acyltransferase PlsY [Caldicellulosiruptor naganoensis]WAM31137.1 glycerol-3-phosphate 1-O-acyltransferase PlsY [Caldicellulosiruptor naganoensis]